MQKIFWSILGTLYFGGAIWAFIGFWQYVHANQVDILWGTYVAMFVAALGWPVFLLLMLL